MEASSPSRLVASGSVVCGVGTLQRHDRGIETFQQRFDDVDIGAWRHDDVSATGVSNDRCSRTCSRSATRSRILNRARSRRVGSRSLLRIESDTSIATTSGADSANHGLCCLLHVGPAAAKHDKDNRRNCNAVNREGSSVAVTAIDRQGVAQMRCHKVARSRLPAVSRRRTIHHTRPIDQGSRQQP